MTTSCCLQTLLTAGHFVLSAELTPPRHHNMRPLMAIAYGLKSNVDVVQISDNALAQARLSNLIAAQFVWHAGIEPIVQMTLRHRNRIALQSDLLGLAALGIRNLVVVSGYPCLIGTDPEAHDVQDMSTIEAIAAINNLTKRGQMFNGDKVMSSPDFFIGTIASTEVKPEDIAASLDDLEVKIDCGAKFVQLQATFDLESLQRWMGEAVRRDLHNKAHFLASIYPFKSVSELNLLGKLPGVWVPDWLSMRVREHRTASFQFNLEFIEGIQATKGIKGLHFRSIHSRNCIGQLVESSRLRDTVAA
jgi:methylenetetrahydrofolate reductase (NADPH)